MIHIDRFWPNTSPEIHLDPRRIWDLLQTAQKYSKSFGLNVIRMSLKSSDHVSSTVPLEIREAPKRQIVKGPDYGSVTTFIVYKK